MEIKLTPEQIGQRRATAYHEAGHVVACLRLGIIFYSVELDTGGGIAGCVAYPQEIYRKTETAIDRLMAERDILVSACGPAAEARATSNYNHDSGFFDRADMEEAICNLVGYPVQLQTWEMRLEKLAYEMFTKEDGRGTRAWWKVMEIAKELLKNGKLSESECMDIAFSGVLPLRRLHQDFRVFPWMRL